MTPLELKDLPGFDGRGCRDTADLLDAFFPEDGEDWRHAKPRLFDAAQRFCARCPIRAECDAAGAEAKFGLWGGAAYHQDTNNKVVRTPLLVGVT
jgi:hypothetical protein